MQARDKAKEILGDDVKGSYPNSEYNGKIPSLKTFIQKDYKIWLETQQKSGKQSYDRIRRCFVQKFGKKLLDNLDPYAFEKWRTQRIKDGIKPSTINKVIALIKAALSKAVQWKIISSNPLAAIKPIKTDTLAKVRFLEHDELSRLRKALDQRESEMKEARNKYNKWRKDRGYPPLPDLKKQKFVDHLKPMILLSINTGIHAKSGKTRHIPLNSEALKTLQDWRSQQPKNNILIFANHGKRFNNVTKTWINILQRAQINNFRWHDMRHHFASKLVMAGVDLNTVRELLGHSDIKMTLRYAHLAPEHKTQAVEKLLLT